MGIFSLLLITGLLLFMAVGLTALILATRNAGDGYEDEAGYHAGRRKTTRLRAPRAVRPILSEQFKIMLMPDVPIRSLILAPGASPKPPRMDRAQVDLASAAGPLMPANLRPSGLNVQLAADGDDQPKRKRKSSARKETSSDGNQLGFPGFAA